MSTGRCLCGAVTYAFTGSPAMVFHCYCRDCQRAGGSLVHVGVMLPEAAVTSQGELRAYTSKADSGRAITRSFCPTCGTGVFNRIELAPGMVIIRAGTLDEPLAFRPTFELYARTRPPWIDTGTLRSFEADITAPAAELAYRG